MNEEITRANIFLYCALPLLEEIIKDDAVIASTVRPWKCVIQFEVIGEELAAHLLFSDGTLKVEKGRHPKPTIGIKFKDRQSLIATFTGKKGKLPKISGIRHIILLIKVLKILKSLNILMPEYEATTPEKKKLKVKLLMYMVTDALTELSKSDEYVRKSILENMERKAQLHVKPDGPSVYMRITKDGIEAFRETCKRPFVSTEFGDIDSAYDILTGKLGFLEGVMQGKLNIIGSPEYARKIGTIMKRVEEVLQPK